MQQITNKVKYFLKVQPYTRNSDFDLAFEIWERGGVVFTPEEKRKIKLAHKLCSFYTIERTRREFRTEFPADPSIEAIRRTEEQIYENHYRR